MRRLLAATAAAGLALTLTAPAATADPGCVYSGGGWLCGGDLPPGMGDSTAARVGGVDRYETSVLLSQAFGSGHDGTAVYLVAHDGIDALALGGYDLNGPILYVSRGKNVVNATVLAHIDDLAPSTVYAIGGTTAVTDAQLAAARAAADQ